MSRCLVIDMASRADPVMDQLTQNGVTTVFRYYASGSQPSLPEKRLTADEAAQLLNRGFSLGVVYQFNNNVLSSMTRVRGREDAAFSIDHARNTIGQPAGSAIYFGVDGDWFTAAQQQKVRDYFEGVGEIMSAAGNPYVVGVYGSGTTCKNLKAANLARLFWLPLSTGWSGTQAFYNGGGWHFYQNFHGLRIGGRFTDTNIVNPHVTNIGTFDRNGLVTNVNQPPSVVATRHFVTTANVKLRSGPGDEHGEVGNLRRRQNVRVMSVAGQWSGIDIDEDGLAEGFCRTGYLAGFDQMP